MVGHPALISHTNNAVACLSTNAKGGARSFAAHAKYCAGHPERPPGNDCAHVLLEYKSKIFYLYIKT
jgi:hypothetical protein